MQVCTPFPHRNETCSMLFFYSAVLTSNIMNEYIVYMLCIYNNVCKMQILFVFGECLLKFVFRNWPCAMQCSYYNIFSTTRFINFDVHIKLSIQKVYPYHAKLIEQYSVFECPFVCSVAPSVESYFQPHLKHWVCVMANADTCCSANQLHSIVPFDQITMWQIRNIDMCCIRILLFRTTSLCVQRTHFTGAYSLPLELRIK